jgi:ABC-type amino acid transport system permease subunit
VLSIEFRRGAATLMEEMLMTELLGAVGQLSLAGGGGMAQVSLFERIIPYLAWGLFFLLICAVVAIIVRRIYRP